MYSIGNEILEALNATGIRADELEKEKLESLIELCKRKYCESKTTTFLWDTFSEYEAASDSDSWSYIKEYVGDKQCIMFFNPSEDKTAFEFRNGEDLCQILSETSGYEFYVTDDTASYLICFNHHDILYGLGNAKSWVKELNK